MAEGYESILEENASLKKAVQQARSVIERTTSKIQLW